MSNQQLPEELHKPSIRKINKRKVQLPFIDNIWGVDLTDIQLISRFLSCIIDIYSIYTWVISLKDKKGSTIANGFQKILDELKRKPNKIWFHKGSEFYNRSGKSWLEKNDIEMYSTHNKGKSIIAERFIRTLKNKICKYMTSILKIVCFDKLDDIINIIIHIIIQLK